MKKILLAILFAALSVGCKNDNDEDMTPVLPMKLTFVENGDAAGITTAKYNGNKVIEINYDDGKDVYTYDGEQITKVISYNLDGSIKETTNYKYSNNKLISETEIDEENGTTNTKNYTWVDDNHVKYSYSFYNGSANEVENRDYYFANGNLTKYTSSHVAPNSTSQKVTTYQYDSSNNPFKNIVGLSAILFADEQTNVNNPLSKTEKSTDVYNGTTTNSTSSTNYTYEFNANNYPLKQTEKKINNDNTIYTYTTSTEYNK